MRLAAALPRPRPAPLRVPRGERAVLLGVGLAVLGTIGVGIALKYALPVRDFESYLGAPWPPFYAYWDPALGPYAAVGALALGAGVLAGPALARGRALRAPLAFALALVAYALLARLALAAARNGIGEWTFPLAGSEGAPHDYLAGVAAVDGLGVRTFLDSFAELSPTLPLHATAHPPGMLLALHALGITSAGGAAALYIGGGVLAAPLTYALGRALAPEATARVAGLLFALAPSALIYGATSADALFAALGAAAAATAVARRRTLRALSPPLLALGAFFSWALLAVGLWAVLVVLAREGRGPALRLALAYAVTVLGAVAALWAATGFDPLGALRAANEAYRAGAAGLRPYASWVWGSPVAARVALGIPVAGYAVLATARRRPDALAWAVTLLLAALLGFAKAETERIWLFLVPLACVAAAQVLPRRRLVPVLGALAVQALAVELLFGTLW